MSRESLEKACLVIIPTAGVDEIKRLPSRSGIRRIDKAVQICRENQNCYLAIVGLEAKIYQEYLIKHYPACNKIVIVSFSAKITNRDMFLAVDDFDNFFITINCCYNPETDRQKVQIKVVTYEWHFRRIAVVLKKLGFRDIIHTESNETTHYAILTELFLYIITILDPFCFHLGLPLVWWTNRTRTS